MRVLLSILLGIILISCNVVNSTNEQENSLLVEMKKKWSSNNTQTYAFENSRICECLPPYQYTVVVLNGKIVDVHFEKQEHITYESKEMIIQSTRTIDELFKVLAQYEQTAYQFEVEYNNEMGYPSRIYIDPSKEIADEEIRLEISKVVLHN